MKVAINQEKWLRYYRNDAFSQEQVFPRQNSEPWEKWH